MIESRLKTIILEVINNTCPVFPARPLQDTNLPFVVWYPTSDQSDRVNISEAHPKGLSGIREAQLTFEIWSYTELHALQFREVLISGLDGYRDKDNGLLIISFTMARQVAENDGGYHLDLMFDVKYMEENFTD